MSFFTDAENAWIAAGGPSAAAPTAAAIASAESGQGTQLKGDVYSGQGATSFGWWQVHTRDQVGAPVNTLPNGTPYDESELTNNVAYNAAAAVNVYKAAGNSFSPWSTFKPDPKTGAPPAYLQYLGGANSAATPAATSAGGGASQSFAQQLQSALNSANGTTPGISAGQAGAATGSALGIGNNPIAAAIQQWFGLGLVALACLAIVIGGFVLLSSGNSDGPTVVPVPV